MWSNHFSGTVSSKERIYVLDLVSVSTQSILSWENMIGFLYLRTNANEITVRLTLFTYMLQSIRVEVLYAGDYSICPITMPCHCEANDVINCASKRLKQLPFFLEFYFIWSDLDLSDNILNQLPREGLQDVKVTKLDLSRNTLTMIHPRAFSGAQGIHHLDLSHNHLVYLPPEALGDLQYLLVLNIAYNRFKSLPEDIFTDAIQLTEINLSGNELKSVPSEALLPLVNLKILTLRNNKIQTVLPNSFGNLPLELLDLGDNHVPIAINPKAFCGLQPRVSHAEAGIRDWTGMHTLQLDHNGLTTVDPCWTKIAWLLQTIDISGNPIICDCNLKYLQEFGTKVKFPNVQCAEPDELAGNLVKLISLEKYNCTGFPNKDEISKGCDDQCRVSSSQMSNSFYIKKVEIKCFLFGLYICSGIAWIINKLS